MLEKYNKKDIKKNIMEMFRKLEEQGDRTETILINMNDWLILSNLFHENTVFKQEPYNSDLAWLYGAVLKLHERDTIIFTGKYMSCEMNKKTKYEFIQGANYEYCKS